MEEMNLAEVVKEVTYRLGEKEALIKVLKILEEVESKEEAIKKIKELLSK